MRSVEAKLLVPAAFLIALAVAPNQAAEPPKAANETIDGSSKDSAVAPGSKKALNPQPLPHGLKHSPQVQKINAKFGQAGADQDLIGHKAALKSRSNAVVVGPAGEEIIRDRGRLSNVGGAGKVVPMGTGGGLSSFPNSGSNGGTAGSGKPGGKVVIHPRPIHKGGKEPGPVGKGLKAPGPSGFSGKDPGPNGKGGKQPGPAGMGDGAKVGVNSGPIQADEKQPGPIGASKIMDQ